MDYKILRMKKTLLFLFSLSLFVSCVPNKDLIYLQGKPVSKKEVHKINNSPYRLRVNDIITIDIKSINPELVKLFEGNNNNNNTNSGNANQGFSNGGAYYSGYSIDNHGNIRLPYFGEINVLGYTITEVRKKIEAELLKIVKYEKDIFVKVKLNGIKYTIMGEVASPGPKVIFQNQVSILDAITNSGDITNIGNRKKVEIIRFTSKGTEKYLIDLTKIDALNSKFFYIKPNDYINVPSLRQKSWGTGTTGLQSLTTIISVFSLVTSTILLVRNL